MMREHSSERYSVGVGGLLKLYKNFKLFDILETVQELGSIEKLQMI